MLYTHDDINNRGGLSRFLYECVYFSLLSLHGDMRRETYVLRANVNHTMLTPRLHKAHLVWSKISTHLDRPRHKLIWSHQIRRTQTLPSTVEPQLKYFSKSSNSQDHIFQIWCHSPAWFSPMVSPDPYPVWVSIIPMMIIIAFTRVCASALSD